MKNRSAKQWQTVDSVIEVPSDESTTLKEKLVQIAEEAARLAVDDFRKNQSSKRMSESVFLG